MTEQESLASKSISDLVEISVAFGDFSLEEAKTKTREELISAISKTELPTATPATKKRTASSKATKSDKTEKAPKASKPAKTTVKKTSEKKATSDAVVIEKEDKPSEKAQSKKKTTRAKSVSKAKAQSPKTSKASEASEAVAPEETQAPASVVIEQEASKQAKTEKQSRRGRPSKKTNDVKAKPSETEETPSQSEAHTKTEKLAHTNDNQKTNKSKKRRISFGPSVQTTEIEIDESQTPETTLDEAIPAVPVEPEIVYTEVSGILSLGGSDKGDFCGFVHRNNYLPGESDAYVPGQMIRRMGLRKGDAIVGLVTSTRGREKYTPLKKIISVNGIPIDENTDLDILKKRKRFENLTAVYPDERLVLETQAHDISTRIIDLFCPIGKGQRGMIVSPPKAGKTILLKRVANAISTNNPNSKLIVLLIDERPEEVTDMQRSINGEVVYSTFDKKPENHVRVTELVLERAMRLVEIGEDVVILLDSMTRLARAYNLTINPTGRTLSGGLDPGSLYGPKRFFGAARNIENGGSLTIIATALIETGSRMDEVIFEEFKGTGNMEVTLDRKLADRRIYPAIAVDKSGTRREDLLLTKEELEAIWLMRKQIADVDTITATDAVINFMKKTMSNESFVLSVKKSFSVD